MNQPSLELDASADDDESPPPSSRPRSVPPPLPAEAGRAPAAQVAADDALAEQMLERMAAADYGGALLAAESLLEFRPLDRDAQEIAAMARGELRRMYIERLGSLDRVPYLTMPLDGLLAQPSLDARAGFVLARIDGLASVRQIVEVGGMRATDTLRILSELVLRRAVAFLPEDGVA